MNFNDFVSTMTYPHVFLLSLLLWPLELRMGTIGFYEATEDFNALAGSFNVWAESRRELARVSTNLVRAKYRPTKRLD